MFDERARRNLVDRGSPIRLLRIPPSPGRPARQPRLRRRPVEELSSGEVFVEVSPGVPDGFQFDTEVNLWSSTQDAVRIFDPEGRRWSPTSPSAAQSGTAF
jgi:hypothetical protein